MELVARELFRLQGNISARKAMTSDGRASMIAAAACAVPVQLPPLTAMAFDLSTFSGKRALLVIDMQNDFVREGAPMEVPEARATLPAVRRLLQAFRAHGAPVVFTRFLATPEPSLLWNWSPACAPPINSCRKGFMRGYQDADGLLDCSDVITELAPSPGEVMIDKYGYGAFHATNLHERLKELGVDQLVLTGTVTQICVEETGREAFHHGYAATIVSDGVSSYAPDLHAAALKNFSLKFGWVEDSATILRAWA